MTIPQILLMTAFAASAKLHEGHIFTAQPPADPAQERFDVLHYDLDINLDMSAAVIPAATLTVTARSLNGPLEVIPFDFDGNGGRMNVTRIDSGAGMQSLEYNHDEAQARLFVTPPKPISSGETFTVRIVYSGIPRQEIEHFASGPYAAYAFTTHGPENTPVVYTKSQPYGARTWWPCKDIPEDKAAMDIHITCPQEYTAVSNGKLVDTAVNPDGAIVYHWRESCPIATYLVSVTCSNYLEVSSEYTSLDGSTVMPVYHYVYPENYDTEGPAAIGGTVYALETLAGIFGEYPFIEEKYSNVTFPRFGGMEHQTCTSLGQGRLEPDGLTFVNVHELAHQWFGDSITMRHHDHLWLNEGLATYAWALFSERAWGRDAYHEEMNAMQPADAALIGPDADQLVWDVIFQKGAWIMHMLRHTVGDDAFFEALHNYVADPDLAYGTALSSDLQSHFERVHGEPLSWFFGQWLYYSKNPACNWSWRTWREGDRSVLALWVEQTAAITAGIYTLPVDLAVGNENDGIQSQRILVSGTNQAFKIDPAPIEPHEVQWDPERWLLCAATQVQEFPGSVLWISESMIDFGETGLGRESKRLLALENLGSETVYLESLQIAGLDSDAFRVAPLPESRPLLPDAGNDAVVEIIFFALEEGAYSSAYLEILTSDGREYQVPLRGAALEIPVDVSEWTLHSLPGAQ